MNNQECKELIFDDIVRVEIYLASECNITLPPTIVLQSLSETANLLGTPLFVAAFTGSDAVMLSEAPSLKVKNGLQTAGNVYSHDLSVPVMVERQQAESLVEQLLGKNFIVAYTRADGSRDLSLPLPDACSCSIDESHSTAVTTTLKAKIRSMSNLIKLTAA